VNFDVRTAEFLTGVIFAVLALFGCLFLGLRNLVLLFVISACVGLVAFIAVGYVVTGSAPIVI
jgi:hypothetical protein